MRLNKRLERSETNTKIYANLFLMHHGYTQRAGGGVGYGLMKRVMQVAKHKLSECECIWHYWQVAAVALPPFFLFPSQSSSFIVSNFHVINLLRRAVTTTVGAWHFDIAALKMQQEIVGMRVCCEWNPNQDYLVMCALMARWQLYSNFLQGIFAVMQAHFRLHTHSRLFISSFKQRFSKTIC